MSLRRRSAGRAAPGIAALGVAWLALALSIASGARAQLADPCVACDAVYACDCGTGLWEIDTSSGAARRIGTLAQPMFDLAVTADGRLVGIDSGGALHEISGCDASSQPLSAVGGNGLGGDLATTDLFAQGPPLVRIGSRAGDAPVLVGGAQGPSPPAWCGFSAGDLAVSPIDGLARTALGCACATGASSLEILDTSSGSIVQDAGCVEDAGGTGYSLVYGLAYDSTGALWAVEGWSRSRLLRIDPDDARVLDVIAVTGGFACGNGLASLPCGMVLPPCAVPEPAPADVGDALRVRDHGPANAADVTAWLDWGLDRGAPRPGDEHFHVLRGTHPRTLAGVLEAEPTLATSWLDATPAAPAPARTIHYYDVRAADACENVSRD